MANNYHEGIIIEFEGETAKFDNSVNGVNKAIKLLQKNVQKLNKEMKIEGESPEKLKKVFEEISKQAELTKQKIALIKNELNKFRGADGNLVRPIDKEGQKEFDNLIAALGKAEVELTKIEDRANKVRIAFEQWDNIQAEKKLRAISDSAKQLGDDAIALGRALAPLSAVAAGALGGAFVAAKDFESAFVGVQKTVDETDFTTYEKLEQTIRRMSTELPSSATEIAKVMEVAGQLGVKADDIEKFTKTIIDLSNATNIMGDEGAMALAQYFNIMQSDLANVDRFGAALTHLGNNSATTEADILNMSKALAAAAHNIGLTDQEVLAMATSLTSLGLSAERGGSSISTILRKVDQAVGENADSVQEWAKITGMSVDEFTKAWNTNTMDTISKMIVGLGTLSEEEKNFYSVLSDLDISNIRQIDTISRLAGAHGMLNEYIEMANKAWDENSALVTEANRRYGTTESQLKILMNTITDIGIELGQAFLPVIKDMVDSMKPFLSSLKDFVSENKAATTALLGTVAALSPGLIVFGKVSKVVGDASKRIADFSEAMRATGKSASEVSSIIGGLSRGLVGVGAIGLLAAFTAVAIAIQNANDQTLQFKNTYEDLSKTFSENAKYADEQYASYVSRLDYVDQYIDKIKNLQNALESETMTEEQSAIVKSQIKQYVEELNAVLGQNVYQFDESSGAITRNGERVKDLKSDYQGLFEELKKSAWLNAHQDQLSQAIANEQQGFDMLNTATTTYKDALNGIDYSNLNVPQEAIQSLQDFADQKISLQELNTQMQELGVSYEQYASVIQPMAQAQTEFNKQAETANQLIQDGQGFQQLYNDVLENGTSILTENTTQLTDNLNALRERKAELEAQQQFLLAQGNEDGAAKIQAEIDKINEKIQTELEAHGQHMLNIEEEKNASLLSIDEIVAKDTESNSTMESGHQALWQAFYNEATTQANGAFNAIDARQLAEKTLTVNVEYNDPLGFITGTGGFPMGFSTGGSGGFAGAGALREGFMNSGGFGDITINNSFTTGGTPSTLQLKQWGRVIANQVNQELGKKVRR